MVADEDVVDLLDAAHVRNHPRLDLLVGEGIRRKPGGERGDGLRCRLPVDHYDVVRGGGGNWRVRSRGGGGGDLAAEPSALALAGAGQGGDVEGWHGGRGRVRVRVWGKGSEGEEGAGRLLVGHCRRRRRERLRLLDKSGVYTGPCEAEPWAAVCICHLWGGRRQCKGDKAASLRLPVQDT